MNLNEKKQLENEIKKLKSELNTLRIKDTKQDQKLKESEKRKEAINKYVDELLNDPEINIDYFPDAIEKKLYKNILLKVVSLMDHVLETTEIKFLNSTIKFDIE